MKPTNIRFAHHYEQIKDTKYNGFTIAYVREGRFVKYAYALACMPDQFSKADGRKFATATLEREYVNMVPKTGNSHLNPFARAGFMCIEEMIGEIELDEILADHVTNKMLMTDFKHAVITEFLDNTIYAYLLHSK